MGNRRADSDAGPSKAAVRARDCTLPLCYRGRAPAAPTAPHARGPHPLCSPQEFEVGARVSCKATFDNHLHPGEVVERRQDEKGWAYYVHYAECEPRRCGVHSARILLR